MNILQDNKRAEKELIDFYCFIQWTLHWAIELMKGARTLKPLVIFGITQKQYH